MNEYSLEERLMDDGIKRMDELEEAELLEEVEHLEETEVLEEVEPLKQKMLMQTPEEVYQNLSQQKSVQIWTKHYSAIPVPLILLDSTLSIIWVNIEFQNLYGDLSNYAGLHLTQFYYASFTEEKKNNLYRSVKSPESVYCWRGQVERKGREEFSVLSNLLILPVFKSPDVLRDPLGYIVILDDVSTEHKKLLRDTFSSLLEASRLKDNDTGNHIDRVNIYARKLTESLMMHSEYSEIDREFLDNISFLAAMHDVGKIGTSDNILNKEGPLHDWEWEIMKEHTINGAYILSTYPNPTAKKIALFHHEKWDGSGYPYGLSKDMIPLSARIVAVADVYDALRMKRPYREAVSHERAKEIMMDETRHNFDPEIFDCFLRIHDEFRLIYEQLRD